MAERLYNTRQVADLLGVTPQTVQEWICRGWLAAEEVPQGETRICEKNLVRFLRDRGVDLKEVMARVAAAEATGPADARSSAEPAASAPPPENRPPAREPPSFARPDALDEAAAHVLDAILRDARSRGASEVYLEPQGDGLALRLRIGGRLYEKPNFKRRLPAELRDRLLARLKAHVAANGIRAGWVLWPGTGGK